MKSFSLSPAAPTPIRLAQIYVCETITYYDMLWFGLESNSNSNLANTLFTACFWQMNWAFSETMPNALLPLGWMLKTKLTLYVWFYCWFLMFLFCIVSCFILSIRCLFLCFGALFHKNLLFFCLSFYRKYLFICHLFWNRSTVNLILFNKQMLCLLLWVIVISSGRCMYVCRIRHLYIYIQTCMFVSVCHSILFIYMGVTWALVQGQNSGYINSF